MKTAAANRARARETDHTDHSDHGRGVSPISEARSATLDRALPRTRFFRCDTSCDTFTP
jgi:hypothetical protein